MLARNFLRFPALILKRGKQAELVAEL